MPAIQWLNDEQVALLKNFFRTRPGWLDISASVSVYQNGAIAAGVSEARYYVDDKIANVICYFSITAAGTAGNPIYVLLPVFLTPVYSAGNLTNLGSYNYVDTGTNIYHGYASYAGLITGLPTIGGFAHAAGAGFIGQTPNFATANGDFMGINLAYRLA